MCYDVAMTTTSLDSFAGHLNLVMGLSDEAVMDFARTRYGTHKALDNFNNVRFGGSALNVYHPLPSADHVRMGLACLANDMGRVTSLLAKNPGLASVPCTAMGMRILAPGKTRIAIEDGLSPLEAVVRTRSWQVMEHLAVQPGLTPESLDKGLRDTFQKAVRSTTLREGRSIFKVALVLMGQGADISRPGLHGRSLLSDMVEWTASVSFYETPKNSLSVCILMDWWGKLLAHTGPLDDTCLDGKGKGMLENYLGKKSAWASTWMTKDDPETLAWVAEKTGMGHLGLDDARAMVWAWIFSIGFNLDQAKDLALESGSPLAPLLLADQLGGMLPAARPALRSPRL
jgi:hypothetical protein